MQCAVEERLLMIKKSKFIKSFVLALICMLNMNMVIKTHAQNTIVQINEKNLFLVEKSGLSKQSFFKKFDANLWKTDLSVFEEFGLKMCFPQSVWNTQTYNYNLFVDLMRNLMWLENKPVIIVIENLSSFNNTNGITTKSLLFRCFQKIILPFWEGKPGTGSVVDCLPCMKPKQFNVYYT